jgi:hypothetical protein
MFLLRGLQKSEETHGIGCCQLKVDIFASALRTFRPQFYCLAANECVLAVLLSDNLGRKAGDLKNVLHGAFPLSPSEKTPHLALPDDFNRETEL